MPSGAQIQKGNPPGKQDPPKSSPPPKQSPPGSGGGLGQGNPPKQTPPPANNPPRQTPPPANNPPRQTPPANNPPKQTPPPANNPPRQTPPPANNPPKQNPPANNGGGLGQGNPPRQTPRPANNPPKQNPPANNGGGLGQGNPPRQTPPPANNPPKQNPPANNGGGLGQGNPPRQTPPPANNPPKQNPPANNGGGLGQGNPPTQNPPGTGGGLGNGNSGNNGSRTQGPGVIGDRNGQNGNPISQPGPKPGFSDRGRIFNPDIPITDQFKPKNPQGPAFNPRTGGFQTDRSSNIPFGDSRAHKTPMAFPVPAGPKIKDPYYVDRNYYYGSHCRYGYTHYYPWWRDWFFGYRWYVVDPWAYRCYFSPYYWYVSIPAYVQYDRVVIITPVVLILNTGYVNWRYIGYGVTYNTYYGGYGYTYASSYRPIDRALSSLTDAFRFEDPSQLEQFLTYDGQVNIYIDGNYAYTLSGADYYDMTADLIHNVYTTNYEIERVRQARTGEFVVVARHDFVDPNNYQQTVWMTFTLQEYRGNFYIVEAGTSRTQPRI